MLANTLDRISFLALFLAIVLLPVFFLPFTKIPVETSKGLLLVVGLTISIIFWLAARLSERKIVFPRSPILFSGLSLVLAFFVSSILSPVPSVSFFGTILDVGSFWFIFACFALMFISSVVLQTAHKAKMVLWGTVGSFAIAAVFQCLHFAIPTLTSFGTLAGRTDNILGSWNALGLFAGLVSIISLFTIEFFEISQSIKWFMVVVIALALFLIAAVNFSLIWVLLGVFALLIFIYKVSFISGYQTIGESKAHFPSFSLAVVMISLLFFVSGQFIGGFLPAHLHVSNTEVTPSLSATISVAKSELSKHLILGSGPNKFGQAWALYKPLTVNSGNFWNIYFESGFGTLLTFAVTTGVLGILALIAFLFFLVRAGIKSIFSIGDTQANFELAVFFISAMYLFVSAFFYSTGVVMIVLTFAFTGVFVGLTSMRQGKTVAISFLDNPSKSFFSIFIIILLIIISAGLGFKYIERFASVPYYERAINTEDVAVAESSIQKALTLNQNDLYLRTYSQIYLIKFNSLVSKGSSISDTEKAQLKPTFDEAVSGATFAVNYDKLNYLNFQTVGYVHGTAGLLGVTGAYDKAIDAYTQASNLNPLDPEIKLSIARAYLAQGKNTQAKDYAIQALNLKPDYVDGLIVMSQIAKSGGDNDTALFYAQRALSFAPDNKDLKSYTDSLSQPTSTLTPKDNTKTPKKK